MAIINVTPDSFSDGGRFTDADEAIDAAKRFIEEGASVIDVGGESTRPGAMRVEPAEQLRRVLPVVERLARETEALISVDTTRAPVARAALDAGAHIINDVSAGCEDPELLPLCGKRAAGVVLMHRLRAPDADSYSDRYDVAPTYEGDLIKIIGSFLRTRAQEAMQCGVAGSSIVIDPGLGFGKTVEQNFELVRRTPELTKLGYPVLSALSRKSFIGNISGIPEPGRRLSGTLAASVIQYDCGVRLFRVHDVGAHREALAVAQAILEASAPSASMP